MNNRFLMGAMLCVIAFASRVGCTDEPTKKATEETTKEMSDAEITKIFVGKWSEVHKTEETELNGETVFNEDGTFKSVATIKSKTRTVKLTLTGTWEISEGHLVQTVLTSDPKMVEKGTTQKEEILSATPKEIKSVNEEGKTSVLNRVDD